MASPRTPIVGGNWKMHLDRGGARDLLRALRDQLDGVEGVDVVICPPAPWLGDAADALDGTSLHVGAQNAYWLPSGAYTGEVGAAMLIGTARYVLVGHSERRHVFGETNEETGRKLAAVLELGLDPILAIGELQAEREAGTTREVLRAQLDAALVDVDRLPDGFVVAYEPVWAIGTGLTATPEIAQSTIADVRAMVADRFGEASADACRIQYGGSVNAGNVADLAAQPDIDGALVGGASLDAEAFATICRTVAAAAEGAN
ncbi:MAG: triose-phosphate isomerase [Chloroflexi bacterium]|nr:triose-phosphate isomerase [Chloroflexota bacterium]